MIFNERQYGITQDQLRKFQVALAAIANKAASANDPNQQICYQAHLDALNSQIESLQQDIMNYAGHVPKENI